MSATEVNDLDNAATLFNRGEFSELARRYDRNRAALRRLEPPHRVLIAHTFALTGNLHTARALAALDTAPYISEVVRSRAELVLGLISEREGDRVSSVQHYQSAIQLAKAANDNVQHAWACLQLFRLLVDGHRMHELRAMLLQVRNVVTKAGHPHLASYLHQCVAILEAQTGRLEEGRRHCEIALTLLEGAPNIWLRGSLSLTQASIAWLNCQFKKAARLVDIAKADILRSGHVRCCDVLDSNLAYVQMTAGHFGKARQVFMKMLNAPGIVVAASADDGLARIHLALGELDQCEVALDRIRTRAGQDASVLYYIRWAGITRARLLMRRRNYQEALNCLYALEQGSIGIDDRPFSAAIHLAITQVASSLQDDALTAARVLAANVVDICAIRELQPQYYFGSAELFQKRSPAFSRQLANRALRLWEAQGNVQVRLEMDAHAATDSPRPGAAGTTRETSHSSWTSCVTDALAAAFDLAHNPRLLGAELVEVIRMLGCSPDVRVVEAKKADEEADASGTHVVLPLGTVDRKQITMVCQAPAEPLNAVLLADVVRIGRAAVSLERARQEERARAALWPAAPVEEQAGALFLAEEMQSLLATARRIAPTSVPVLITGETGTGKEVLARLIHAYSPRASATFLPFNCTATPKEMLDAQLFGYRKGSFTGAAEHFPGVIRAAAGGTLFLDEIGETTLDVQPKLLRFLESGEIHPIGELQPVQVAVRVIAATNANLDALVSQNRFREDLFYRLNIVRLHVPPLRERRVEIPALADHYLQKHAQEYGKRDLRLAEETIEYLVLYRWPGNVRQLANEMRRLAALAEDGAVMMPEHLSAEIVASRRTIPASERVLEPTEVVVRLDQPLAAAVQHIERSMMLYAMRKCGGRMEDTAAMLGLSRKGLYLKRQRYGFEPVDTLRPVTDGAP